MCLFVVFLVSGGSTAFLWLLKATLNIGEKAKKNESPTVSVG